MIIATTSKIGRFHRNAFIRKPKTPSRPSSAASTISSSSTASTKRSSLPKPTPNKRPSSAIPTPCGVAKTYLTTEEVLAKVQEKPTQKKSFLKETPKGIVF